MYFQADFDTDFGPIRATWTGGNYIHLYPGDTDQATDVINIWDYSTDKPRIERNAKAMAQEVKTWLYEMERGITILSVRISEQFDLDDDEQW